MKIITFLLVIIQYSAAFSQQKVQAFSSNLPIVIIDTKGQSIANSYKIIADMGVIYNGEGKYNQTSDPFNNFNGKIGIELRGSSSLSFPKKQYAVETRDSAGANLEVSLMGLPEDNDWILNGPYSDKTLMRNAIVYHLSNQMGQYASRSKFCEVFINNDYKGVYVLLEKVKRGKNRVDIAKMTPADTTGEDLTGGYIIKIDKTDGENVGGWTSTYTPYAGAWQRTFYQYHYPKPDEIVSAQRIYIVNYIKKFESLMYSSGYNHPVDGYTKMIDVNSFVNFFLLNELSRNVDGYRLSSYMYKDKDKSDTAKLYMGPVWDYNIALGNADYYDAQYSHGWMLDNLTSDSEFLSRDGYVPPFWWKKLWSDAAFKQRVKSRWVELRHSVLKFDRVYGYMDSLTTLFKYARIRNFARWPVLGTWVWPNPYVGNTYENEINHLKTWIKERFLWIDNALTGAPVEVSGETFPTTFILYQNYPNPFNSETILTYSVNESSFVKLDVFDILGKHIASLVDQFHQPGTYSVVFNGSGLSGGIYLFRLKSGYFTSTKKGIYLK